MGIYDRGYYKREPAFGFSTGRVSNVIKTLIIINVVVFLADLFSSEIGPGGGETRWLSNFLALKSDLFTHPWQAWQLLTAGFTHAPLSSSRGFMHLFGNMLGLFVFGSALEQHYGSKEFLRLYLCLIVGANLVWVVAQTLTGQQAQLYGASGAVAGLVVLYAVLFPQRKLMIIPIPVAIPAWVIGILFVGGDLWGALAQRDGGVAYVVHLAGAALGFLYFRSGIRLSDYFPDGFSLPKWNRPKLRLHQPRSSGGPKNDRRADEILEKVHKHGADSITEEERKILDEYSRRMRQKLR
jgi:membrane associated rhomboid family serine protease